MRKCLLLFTAALLILTAAGSASAEFLAEPSSPVSGPLQVYLDGKPVDTYGLAQVTEDGILVPLRPVSNALGATEVKYDSKDVSARVTAPGLTLYVPFGKPYFQANGRYLYTKNPITSVNQRCLVPLEELAAAFGAGVVYDAHRNRATLIPGDSPIEPGDTFYNSDDVYWLSHIIQAEAGGEPFAGKIAVGNVVLNRVADEEFPDTVKEVIFDRRGGVQFTPAYSGSVYRDPSEDSVIAAKIALEGVMIVRDGLYFASTRAAKTCWASRHYPVVAEIGGHVFFG